MILRFARIYPVHLFTLLIVLAMVMLASRAHVSISPEGYGKLDFLLNLLLMQTWVPEFHLSWNYPSWSISSEWFVYLLFPIYAYLRSNSSKRRPWLVLVWFILSVVAYIFAASFWFRELFWVVPTFFLGCELFLLDRTISLRVPKYIPEVMWFGMLASCFIGGAGSIVCILFFMTCGIASLLRLKGECTRIWTTRWILIAGEISYSLYMTHAVSQKLVNVVLPATKYAEANWFVKLSVLFAYSLVVLFATLATYYVIELPFRGKARRWASLLQRPRESVSVS